MLNYQPLAILALDHNQIAAVEVLAVIAHRRIGPAVLDHVSRALHAYALRGILRPNIFLQESSNFALAGDPGAVQRHLCGLGGVQVDTLSTCFEFQLASQELLNSQSASPRPRYKRPKLRSNQ